MYIDHFLFLSGHEGAESDHSSLAPCGVCVAQECMYVGVCIGCNGRKVKNVLVDHFLLYCPKSSVWSILMDSPIFLHLCIHVAHQEIKIDDSYFFMASI